jgi:hypothetical protein
MTWIFPAFDVVELDTATPSQTKASVETPSPTLRCARKCWRTSERIEKWFAYNRCLGVCIPYVYGKTCVTVDKNFEV